MSNLPVFDDLVRNLLNAPPRPVARPKPKRRRVTSDRPRDVQKSKLYRAERAAWAEGFLVDGRWATGKTHGALADIIEVAAFVEEVTNSRWWKGQGYRRVKLDTKYRGRTTSRGGWGEIHIVQGDAWHLCKWVVLHELAHAVNNSDVRHGPQFAKDYLNLVGRWIGKNEADALRRHFVAQRVKHRVVR